MKSLQEICSSLQSRGFEASVCTADEARARVLAFAKDAASVGWGGSQTLKDLALPDAIRALGCEIRDHRTDCDLFLLSANALLEDGRLVNVDGSGNRVAGSIWGPKRVVWIIGRNKAVDGGIDDALARIRRVACPPNAKRLGLKTPCGLTGTCTDCNSPDRMCHVVTVFERPPRRTPTTVLLVDADLGY